MSKKPKICSPLISRPTRPAEIVADWWRQLDRWVNEGGAEDRAKASWRQDPPEGRHAR